MQIKFFYHFRCNAISDVYLMVGYFHHYVTYVIPFFRSCQQKFRSRDQRRSRVMIPKSYYVKFSKESCELVS